jgi:hypothetical protein
MTNDKTSTTFSYSQSFCSGRVSHQEKFTTRIHRGKKTNGKTSWVVHSQIPFAGFFLPRERSTESTQASSASSQSSGKSFYDKHRTNTYGSNRNSIKPQACRFRHNSQLLPTAASSKQQATFALSTTFGESLNCCTFPHYLVLPYRDSVVC